MDQYEKYVLCGYVTNVLSDERLTQKMSSSICDWLEDNLSMISSEDIGGDVWSVFEDYSCALRDHSGIREQQKKFIDTTLSLLSTHKTNTEKIVVSALENNLALLTDQMEFNDIDRRIFNFVARYRVHNMLESLVNDLGTDSGSVLQIISLFTQLDEKNVANHLSINSHLVSSGAIKIKTSGYNGKDLDDRFDLPEAISAALISTCDNPDDIRSHILGNPATAELEWEDFSHLKETRQRLCGFLKKSLQQNLSGINILLWGPPGTGKTEFCKTLAKKIDCNLYAIGEIDNEGDEPNRRERLEALKLSQSILRYQRNNLLMFDEMDDLFERPGLTALFGGKMVFSSKIFTNRLFENNPVPTLWILNDVASLDESVVRRMSLVVEIKSPPKSSRQKVWERIIAKHNVDIPEQAVTELMNLDVSPAVLNNAVRFAHVNGRGAEDILFASEGIVRAIKGKKPLETRQQMTYCPELLNADMDLNELGCRLKETQQRRFSLCLYGPPGTGKTEYIRQLANQLGMEILVKRTSDLLGKYVGETEVNIAAAFQEAQEKESFLIFDEADSLLGDRRHASHGWEISQVNEMLTWMESHPLPFACTTNLMERLDQASLRRFTFKVKLEALTEKQIPVAFKKFFDIAAPASSINLRNVTPGDFVVVRNKAKILGIMDQPEQLIEMLAGECLVKNDNVRQIGFIAS